MNNPVILLLLLLMVISLFTGCSDQSSEAIKQPNEPTVETLEITLPTYPEGLVPGTEGWIPPLPQGMSQPRPLSEEEWSKVSEIARTNPIIAEHNENDNLCDIFRYWVGYSGGPGHYANPDSAVMSGDSRLPDNNWFYPAIWFDFQTVTDRHGQLVGVDLDSERIVLSSPLGPIWAVPPFRRPPSSN